MFRQLATWYESLSPPQPGADTVFGLHPLQLTRFLEEMWLMRSDQASRPSPAVPRPIFPLEAISGIQDALKTAPHDIYPTTFNPDATSGKPGGVGELVPFRHLMYAYMIENTRAFEIFRRVLEECTHGENLDVPSPEGQNWLRTTEALFFSDPHPGGAAAVTSVIRPDARAVRRNAYYRMFGIDLNHGQDDGSPYPYVKATASNREFVLLFEEFLREVWRGVENFKNTSGANSTDDAAIGELGATLADILTVRRRNGALSREEFFAVAAMSWFHLTLMSDTAIVVDLKSAATSPEERLRKLGERVGYPYHPKSEQYFAMADAISNILLATEARQFANPTGAAALYAGTTPPDPPNLIRADMMTIIAQWSIATGRDMKAHKPLSVAGHPARMMPAPPVRPKIEAPKRPQLPTSV
jgi:hypothetical protein